MSHTASKSQRCCELFSINNRNLVNNWKVHSSVKKVYDDQSKTFVYCLKGKSPIPLMKWPKDKTNVPSTRPVLVFQMCAPPGASILIDIGVAVRSATRRRVTLSSNLKKRRVTELSVAVPLTVAQDSTWCHLLVDVDAAVSLAWKKERLKSIDSIDVGGAFSVRRIFAVSKDMIHNSEGIWMVNYDELPKQMSISRAIPQTYISITCSDEAPAGTEEEGCRRTDSDRTAPSSSRLHFDRNRLAEDGAVKPSTKLKPPKVSQPKVILVISSNGSVQL
ncbi:hypothetical protein AVEN_226147-1 [Araneus ventricosus]|uniref:CFA20 domain-containing protein n=1 Tax=Araneus ventricosus TaxID=182803 RepID=A0A4Y2M0L1_ARAVE|nr:hypothetical protein AVEN_226147-1 [Araneus ventricosus]